MHLVKRDLFFVVYTIATHTHISEKSTCHNCFILLVRQSQHFDDLPNVIFSENE